MEGLWISNLADLAKPNGLFAKQNQSIFLFFGGGGLVGEMVYISFRIAYLRDGHNQLRKRGMLLLVLPAATN